MKLKIVPPRLHDGQLAILNSKARFKVARCGRRFGKTMLAGCWLSLMQGGAIEGYPVAYFAPKYKLLLDVWDAMRRTLTHVIVNANKTEMRITLKTGGTIDFWTLEDADAGRGRKYARIVIDEAAHARYLQEAWERAIAPTLTDYEGDAWFISTPNGINYFHELYGRGTNEDYPEWVSFHMPSSTNPYLSEKEIEARRSEMPNLVFMQEYLAEFVTFGAGLVKPDYISIGKPLVKLPVVLGVDLAISEKTGADYTAIVAMSRDVNGKVYVLEVERHRCGFHDVIERIKEAAVRHNPVMIAIEQTQYQAAVIQELTRTTKLPVKGIKPDKDKVTRFLPLLTRYEQGLVKHAESLPAWFRDEIVSFPNGEHDDAVDASAYAFMVAEPYMPGAIKAFGKSGGAWS